VSPGADGPELIGPPLSGYGQYDRAALRRTDPDWLAAAWASGRVLPIDARGHTPAAVTGLGFVTADTVDPARPRRFLGVVEDVPYFTVTVPEGADGSGDWVGLRQLGGVVDELSGALLVAAVALEQWHQRHQRCPLCGQPTVETHAGWQRHCPADGSEHFPRTDPAVIMLVDDGAGRALLGRGRGWDPGRFSTLAGFVEPGESLEAAVAREVFEETGVGVGDIRYVASQPWPFPASLMVGFTATLVGDPAIHLDPVELAEARWFTRAEVAQVAARADARGGVGQPAGVNGGLRSVSPKLSISRYLIDRWLAAP
jgi:NAD+ diphosphatase